MRLPFPEFDAALISLWHRVEALEHGVVSTGTSVISTLEDKVKILMAIVEDLRAAREADEATDAKLVALVADLRKSVDALTAKLAEAPTVDVAALQAEIDAIKAHTASVEATVNG